MSFAFHLGNSVKIFRRRKRSVLRIMLAAMCATVAASLAIAGYFATKNELDELSGKIVFSVFFSDSVNAENIGEHIAILEGTELADSIRVVSPDEAKAIFFADKDTASSLLMPDNPFPYLAELRLRPQYRSSTALHGTIARLRALPEVEDLVYRADFADALFRRTQQTILLAIVTGSVAFMLFLFVLRNALRSEMAAASGEMGVLHIMGARRGFIAMPHILFAVLAGMAGIITGGGLSFILFYTLRDYLPWIGRNALISTGISAGLIFLLSLAVSIATAMGAARRRTGKPRRRRTGVITG